MTRALFVHDHRFTLNEGEVFSDRFPYQVWRRYLVHFESLTVTGRASQDVDRECQQRSSGAQVSFELLDSASNMRALILSGGHNAERLLELVHSHDAVIIRLPSELGLLAAKAALRARRPVLIEVVGCGWDAAISHGRFAAKLYAPLLGVRMRRAIAKASYVTYVSQRFLQNRYPAKCAIACESISNVEIPSVSLVSLERRLRRMSVPSRPLVLGLIGSLHTRYKGVDVAIKALRRLVDVGLAVRLRILSSGDARAYIHLARSLGVLDNVQFEGFLPAGQPVFDWLDDIDVYCQPSYTEGLPRALIEAMSRACPCVTSTAGGMPEIVDEKCLFPPGASDRMAAVIRRLVDDPSEAKCQSFRNFETAKRYLSKDLSEKREAILAKLKRDAANRA